MNLKNVNSVVVLGGGTAGWIASFFMHECFPEAKVTVVESSALGIIGAGEGTFRNFNYFLERFEIDETEFMEATEATFKLGIQYENWKNIGDQYFHFFLDNITSEANQFQVESLDAFWAYLVSKDQSVDRYSTYHSFVEHGLSQNKVREYINHHKRDKTVTFGYHFDAHKVAKYLRQKAMERGIAHMDCKVESAKVDKGRISSLLLEDNRQLDADFFIDASGFHGVLMRKSLGVEWVDFSQHLPVNAALTFLRDKKATNPPLVTKAIALKYGWMWQIPTGSRLGCGYVHSNQYIDKDYAQQEVEMYLGEEIDPLAYIKMQSGTLETYWKENCMAVGLASGFVEPLEATSIAQTIAQLDNFRHVIQQSGGFVTADQISNFNRRTKKSYEVVRDFLIIHYMSERRDSPFWREIGDLNKPDSVKELLEIYQNRMPREFDCLFGFESSQIFFPPYSFYSVCQPMGILDPKIAASELEDVDNADILILEQHKRKIHKELLTSTIT